MGNTLRVNCDARQLQQQSQTCSLSHTYPDLVNVMDVSNKCKCIFLYFFQPCLCLQSFSVKWQIQNPFGCFPLPCLIYINRYFILQFDRLFFNLIYTPSINWSEIWRSEGVSAVVGEELGREDEFRIQQFGMDFRITFHDVSFNALSIIYQKCISSFIFGLYSALSEWGA